MIGCLFMPRWRPDPLAACMPYLPTKLINLYGYFTFNLKNVTLCNFFVILLYNKVIADGVSYGVSGGFLLV